MTVEQLLFALLRTALCEQSPDDRAKDALAVHGEALVALAKQQDLMPLIAEALRISALSDTAGVAGETLYREQMLAVFRHEQQQHDQSRVEKALADAQIAYLPLKGAVIRAFYPEPWMRTSCDVDVLVHEQDTERAIKALEAIGFCMAKRNYHDISMHSESGTHLELHFTIMETLDGINALLSRVWEFCAPTDRDFCYAMSPEFFLFHTVAHMAHHFVAGGCGIRPFLDIWVWRQSHTLDMAQVEHLLAQGGILDFYRVCERLIDVWFKGEPHDDLTHRVQAYLLHGGAYGSVQAQVAMKQHKKGGKLGYICSRVFLPYDMLRHYYPVLDRHKWLYPAMQVRRWGRLLAWRRAKRSMRELAASNAVTPEQAKKTERLLKDVGLS